MDRSEFSDCPESSSIMNENEPLNKRIDYLYKVFSSERFLNMKGIGRETSYYICPFHPQEAAEFNKQRTLLANRLRVSNGIDICEIDLYDLTVEILKEEDAWDAIREQETELDKHELLETLRALLDPGGKLLEKIQERAESGSHKIIFISGIGEVYPWIRTHNLIENMQTVINGEPVVLFFPGSYIQTETIGLSLELFDKFTNERYYRAYNIFNFGVD